MRQSSFFAQAGGILLGGGDAVGRVFRGQIGLAIASSKRGIRAISAICSRPPEDRRVHRGADAGQSRAHGGRSLPATLLAIWFFGFSLYSLGDRAPPFFVSLIAFGWSIGLFVAGLVLRYGLGAEASPGRSFSPWRPCAGSITRPRYCRPGFRL
jgi:hypothetical protein